MCGVKYCHFCADLYFTFGVKGAKCTQPCQKGEYCKPILYVFQYCTDHSIPAYHKADSGDADGESAVAAVAEAASDALSETPLLFGAVFKAIGWIFETVEKVKANREQCLQLVDRVRALEPDLKRMGVSPSAM